MKHVYILCSIKNVLIRISSRCIMKYYSYDIPSSCMVITVHVVKVVNIVCTFDVRIVEMESETDSWPREWCFNHRDELNSAVQLPKCGSWTACYIAIEGSYRDYVSQEAILVRESSMQLIRYLCIRYSTYLQSQKGSIEALNFLPISSDFIIIYLITTKINCYWGYNEKLTTSLVLYHT